MKPFISTLLLLFLTFSTVASAEEALKEPPKNDKQLTFQFIFFNECKKSIHSITLDMTSKITMPPLTEAEEEKVCACTAKVASEGKKMQVLFELPPDKIKDAMQTEEFSNYVKAKVVFSTLKCSSFMFDQILETNKASN